MPTDTSKVIEPSKIVEALTPDQITLLLNALTIMKKRVNKIVAHFKFVEMVETRNQLESRYKEVKNQINKMNDELNKANVVIRLAQEAIDAGSAEKEISDNVVSIISSLTDNFFPANKDDVSFARELVANIKQIKTVAEKTHRKLLVPVAS